MAIRFFDMFAGIGGFRSGLTAVGGFECIGHCEIDKYANQAYCAMYETRGEYYCADAKKINPEEMPNLDLICAGFPCQSFSVAGKRLGFADTRGTLFFEVARIAEAKRPAFLLLENVPGLLSHDGGRTLNTIFSALVELGYNLEWCVLNSKYFGVPQQRRRLFIVGYGYEEGTDYSDCDELTFQTAWSAPHPILRKLSEMFPEIVFKHQWADEDIGMNCGERCYLGGEKIDEFIPEGIRATEFALEVWDYDPLELGMAKNSTGTAYVNIENESYQLIELFGKPALFSNDRITPKDIPEGLYCYDLRHSDDGDRFCSVEPKVAVNHGGSVITDIPLDFGEKGYIPFSEDTEPNFLSEYLTIAEYMNGEFELSDSHEQTVGGMQL